MCRKNLLVALFCLFSCVFSYADHSPLLPQPQNVQYRSGDLKLGEVLITFSHPPSAEDRFAAEQLSLWMKEKTGYKAPVGGSPKGQITIELDRSGSADVPLALPDEKPGPESREAYDLSVTEQGVKIHARSSPGIFYGVQTLRQLIEGEGPHAVLPFVEIRDWPSLAFRGTMVDMSHGPLPTEKEIERQLDFLARWKENQYYLYSENSIELDGYPLVDHNASLTKDEIRRIVAYGRERHIDVIPNFDLYGHQHDLFRVEKYSDLADMPHGTEFDPRNPKVLPLLTDWVNQFSELFPSPFVSIGFDETFQIDAASRASGMSAESLFIKQLSVVASLFQQHGKRVMAYDDIMVKYPGIVHDLPKGLIAVAWYYTSEDPEYKRWLDPLIAQKVPHVVQPGVWSWNEITPDFDITAENIDTFLAAGRKSGALGLVNSVWTDDAQMLMRMSLPGMAYGAAAPWQSTPMDKKNFFSNYARIVYSEAIAPDVSSALGDLNLAQTSLEKALGTDTIDGLWKDPFFPVYKKKWSAHLEELHETRIHAEMAEEALIHANRLGAPSETLNSLMIGAQLLDYAGFRYQTAQDMEKFWGNYAGKRPDDERWWHEWKSLVGYHDHSPIADLADQITDLKPAYRAEWLAEYAPYRLGSSLGRWDAEYQYWLSVSVKLNQFSDATHEGDPLPPLDEIISGPRPDWLPKQ